MQTVERACLILKTFRDQSECLRLSDVVARTGLHKTTALRILSALVLGSFWCGWAILSTNWGFGHWESGAIDSDTACRVLSSDSAGRSTESLQRSAEAADIDLLVLDNQDSARIALRNAEVFVNEKVDLVIRVTNGHAHCRANHCSLLRGVDTSDCARDTASTDSILWS